MPKSLKHEDYWERFLYYNVWDYNCILGAFDNSCIFAESKIASDYFVYKMDFEISFSI